MTSHSRRGKILPDTKIHAAPRNNERRNSMPINTLTCPSCGARTNYTVELDENNEQSVTCIRCGESFNVDYDDLPERLQETITELAESDSQFASDMDEYAAALNGIDTVEETIQQVDNAFAKVKQEMSSFNKTLQFDEDTNALIEQYTSLDSANAQDPRLQTKSQSGKNQNWKDKVKQAASNKAQAYARQKIADKFGATEEELDDIFAIAGALQSRANSSEMSISQFIKNNPGEVTQLIAENAFTEDLAPQLIKMMGSGSFTTIMDIATSIDGR